MLPTAGLCQLPVRMAILRQTRATHTHSINIALSCSLVSHNLPAFLPLTAYRQELIGGAAPTTVVHTTSALGSIADESTAGMNLYSYCASKAALNMAAVTMSRELAQRNVTTVLMHPGGIQLRWRKG